MYKDMGNGTLHPFPFSGKTPTCSRWPLDQHCSKFLFCLYIQRKHSGSYIDRIRRTRPEQHPSANLLQNKYANPNLSPHTVTRAGSMRGSLRKGDGKRCAWGASISLPNSEGSRVISSTVEVCVANTTSQIRQILSRGIIYFFLLRHAERRLKWWVNRFLRTQF